LCLVVGADSAGIRISIYQVYLDSGAAITRLQSIDMYFMFFFQMSELIKEVKMLDKTAEAAVFELLLDRLLDSVELITRY
jgi:hypothetical protein